MMKCNPIGRTGLLASAVGFGTCQLRLVPERQAIDTLKSGFELGVNLVHTSPDYEGADELVVRAANESGHDVMILSQGYGEMPHFRYLFERACEKFKKRPLEMFGIGCIDDREYLGENVWGPGGMIQFLLKMKREGRLTGIFCSTHGNPEYVSRLTRSGHFDAIMLSYNALGFHLLSYHPEPPKKFENINENESHIFPLAKKHGVSLFIMKPLAGGLLCRSRTFPPLHWFPPESAALSATNLLRTILMRPEVCSVIPGTASVEEAQENALAGHYHDLSPSEHPAAMESGVSEIRSSLCSRCGKCEPLCSKSLPISWLFRDAYICNYPSETFETLDRLQYFHLHPWETASCESCDRISCQCPRGIDIPAQLIRIHHQMLKLKDQNRLPLTPSEGMYHLLDGTFPLKVIRHDVPRKLAVHQEGICRFYLENAGKSTWKAPVSEGRPKGVGIGVFRENRLVRKVPLRQDVDPGNRGHFSFLIKAPGRSGNYVLTFALMNATGKAREKSRTKILASTLSVAPLAEADPLDSPGKWFERIKKFLINMLRVSFRIK